MFAVQRQIEIEASPEETFSFLDDPQNHVKITPALIEVGDIEALPNGGKRARYRYKLSGVTLAGHVKDVTRSPGDRLVQQLTGTIEGEIDYDLVPISDGTRVEYDAEYELPTTVVDTVLAPIAQSYNEREAESTLANLKAHLEA